MVASIYADDGSSYNYDYNGADWGTSVPLCDSGVRQSPIDLPGLDDPSSYDATKSLLMEGEKYTNYAMQTVNYGSHTIKVTTGAGNYYLTDYEGETYPFTFAQFHMHAPSEHTRDGQYFDMEMHFVHVFDSDSTKITGLDMDQVIDNADYAVIGVFFDRQAGGNRNNDFLEQMNLSTDVTTSGNVTLNNSLAVSNFLGGLNFDGFYHYDGSFTTPPCTEGVKWAVLNQVQPISDAQLARMTNRWAGDSEFANGKGNNREVQPYNERVIYFSGAYGLAASMATALVAVTMF